MIEKGLVTAEQNRKVSLSVYTNSLKSPSGSLASKRVASPGFLETRLLREKELEDLTFWGQDAICFTSNRLALTLV
jgi:hypothetical protein